MNPAAPTTHPWIDSLQVRLDRLERALLAGDAAGVEQASADVQTVLQQAPKTAAFSVPGTLRSDMQQAAQRFGQLRQAVLRAHAKSQRAVNSLLPQQAPQTYGAVATGKPFASSGAGQAYLRA